MSREQISQLHHFSLRGRKASFSEAYRYFGANKELGQKNVRYAERLKFVAAEHKRSKKDINVLVNQALQRWPL
jgi:hypothetical protein